MADLIGQVTLLSSSEGGRHLPAYSGFHPHARLPQGTCPFALRFMCDDSLRPGESDAATIDVDTPDLCRDIIAGQVFDLLENKRVIGRVTILENLWTERQKKTRTVSLTNQMAALGVADLDTSIAFYHGIGFEILHEHTENGPRQSVQLKCGNVNVLLNTAGPGHDTPAHRDARGGVCLHTTCDDVIALHHFLTEHAYEPTALQTGFYGMMEFQVVDPDGYRILFAQPSPAVAQ